MDSRQEAKLSMYRTVQQVLTNNQSISASNVAFTNAANALSAKISAIVGASTSETAVITGIAAGKKEAKDNLCQSAADMASIVSAYASATNNTVLIDQANYPVSELKRLKDNELPQVCTNILKAANDNSAALATYGITPAMITAFETSISNYSLSVPKPASAKSEKSVYTKNLVELIKEADAILKEQLDKLIVTFKATTPDFVTSYKSARTIIDPGTRKSKTTATPSKAA